MRFLGPVLGYEVGEIPAGGRILVDQRPNRGIAFLDAEVAVEQRHANRHVVIELVKFARRARPDRSPALIERAAASAGGGGRFDVRHRASLDVPDVADDLGDGLVVLFRYFLVDLDAAVE